MINRIRNFVQNRDGIAAVEFALIAPALIMLYVGMVEMVHFGSASTKVSSVGGSIADLVARSSFVDDDDIATVFSASSTIMGTIDDSTLQVVISSVAAQADGTYKVAWSDGFNGGTAKNRCTTLAMPSSASSMMATGESVIVTEISYTHSLLLGDLTIRNFGGGADYIQTNSSLGFSEVFYQKPRLVGQIERCTTKTSGLCPALGDCP